ncbi:MAG: deoxyribonuclease IV [Blastocatellia bacterium]|nr:deoxyribonuclease IV [Blastocatellia bacterium]
MRKKSEHETTNPARSPALGVHTGIAGGLYKSILDAKSKGCQTWQIFSRNPRGWEARPLTQVDINLFRGAHKESKLGPCLIHANYLINLAAPDSDLRTKSILAFHDEIARGLAIGADYLVVHPGSDRGASVEKAIENCGLGLQEASSGLADQMWDSGFQILIENTAGQGGQIGRTFEQVRDIISLCPDLPLGMCLDTAHSFAAGYDLRDEKATKRAMSLLGETVGFEKVKAVHFNDSKAAFESRVDRHWHIGKGEIGGEGLARIINHPKLSKLPFILETPVDDQIDDVKNLAAARALIVGADRPRSRKSL